MSNQRNGLQIVEKSLASAKQRAGEVTVAP